MRPIGSRPDPVAVARPPPDSPKPASPSVLHDQPLIRRRVNAVDLVVRNEALDPLNLRSQLTEHLQGLQRLRLNLCVRRYVPGVRLRSMTNLGIEPPARSGADEGNVISHPPVESAKDHWARSRAVLSEHVALEAARFNGLVTEAILSRLSHAGVRVRSYALSLGAVVPSAVWDDVEPMLLRLRADLGGSRRLCSASPAARK